MAKLQEEGCREGRGHAIRRGPALSLQGAAVLRAGNDQGTAQGIAGRSLGVVLFSAFVIRRLGNQPFKKTHFQGDVTNANFPKKVSLFRNDEKILTSGRTLASHLRQRELNRYPLLPACKCESGS